MSRIDDLEKIIAEADDDIDEIINDFAVVLQRFERRRDAEKVAAAFNEFFNKHYPEVEGEITADTIIDMCEFGQEMAELAEKLEKTTKEMEKNTKTLEEMVADKGW